MWAQIAQVVASVIVGALSVAGVIYAARKTAATSKEANQQTANSVGLEAAFGRINMLEQRNDTLSASIETVRREASERIAKVERARAEDKAAHDEQIGGLKDQLTSAETYITRLLAWIREHLPGREPPARTE